MRLARDLPLRDPIFLPTETFDPVRAVAGLERVRFLYRRGLDEWHRPRLRGLRERYEGAQRCFIIGNGPSLNRMDLEWLRDEVTFAVNGFFLKARTLPWCPTFYVVEDHLVAEDRLEEIRSISGPTKLFPAYLGYCFEEAEDTIFFDHHPRPSYPNGFDFSLRADHVTYTGCTVTFTCLQLAAYLGFREIYLIGVDADYQIPADVTRVEGAGVGVLDMQSEDANHFDPSYFGRGYRWHDPQLDKMLEAYEEARWVTSAEGIEVFNAGVGGKLEVFPRVAFASLFERPRPVFSESQSDRGDSGDRFREPRVVIIDITRRGDGSASGELKRALLGDWDSARLLEVFGIGAAGIGVAGQIDGMSVERHWIDADEATGVIRRFAPDCVLYRPLPDNLPLHDLAVAYLESSSTPLITWIHDDWMTRAAGRGEAPIIVSDLSWLLARSSKRLVISDAMARAFSERYELDFVPVANGVDVDDWPVPRSRSEPTLKVRYAGALAEDMVLSSVVRVARVVDALAADGVAVAFEVNTAPQWVERATRALGGFCACSVTGSVLSEAQYRNYLSGADVNLIAYNFDERSTSYIRYSLANKLPECLACGQALLVHGPSGLATVDAVWRALPDAVVTEPSEHRLRQWLLNMTDPDRRSELAGRCRELALSEYNLDERRRRFRDTVTRAAAEGSEAGLIRYRQQRELAHLDKCAVIDRLTAARYGSDRVMIDVGPNCGGSASSFIRGGWTVHAPPLLDAASQSAIGEVDFLRIDGEEIHHALLASVPWKRWNPRTIMWAFEGRSVDLRGPSWSDMAEFLGRQGYTVYVSEWYPMSDDGLRSRWRSLRRYPCKLVDTDGWGQLLAFQQPPPRREMERVVDEVLVTHAPLVPRARDGLPQRFVRDLVLRGRLAGVKLSVWLRRRSPGVWKILRAAKRRLVGGGGIVR